MHSAQQRWSDSGFLLSDPILFLKNDIRIWSESCLGWNHTIRIRKLSESVLWCTTYIFCVVSILPHEAKYLLKLFYLKLNTIGWSSHMTSL